MAAEASERDVLHLRFFLSSPGDVADERRAAQALVEGLARRPAFRGRISTEVIAYDDPDAPAPLAATEPPQASVGRYAGTPADCDLTIVILWGRLGTPLPSDVCRANGSRYESGTVWELEDAQRAGREVWIYRRAEEPRIGLKDPNYAQKRAAFEQVEAYLQGFTRADASLARGFNPYTGPQEFSALLAQQLESFVAKRLETARPKPSTPERGEVATAPRWNWPTPWDFSAYIREKRRGFVGRRWLFDTVRTWHAEQGAAQALLILADYGVGKSAIMATLAEGAHVPVVAHHFCHRDTLETLNPGTFVRNVAAQLAGDLPAYKAAVEADPAACALLERADQDPASAFERAVIAPLHALEAPAGPLVLLVDGLDEALDYEPPHANAPVRNIVQLLASRAQRLPEWLKVLATTRRRRDVLQPLQHAFRCETLNAEDSDNLTDIRDYTQGRCGAAPLRDKLAAAGLNPAAVSTLLSNAEQSGGKFLYAVRVLNDLESGALTPENLTQLPPGMDGFYLDAFARRFGEADDYEESVSPLLGVLCVQREPMTRAELAGVLSAPEKAITSTLAKIEDFVTASDRRYACDHLSFTQWLTEEDAQGYPRAGRFAADRAKAQELRADWARREASAGRAHQSEYLARHLGAHLSAEQRRELYPRLLLDLRWLDARLRAAGVQALLGDFRAVDATPALNALERALQQAAHVIGQRNELWSGAHLLAQQILGRLQHRGEAELQALCASAASWIRARAEPRPLTASLQSSSALLRTLQGHTSYVLALAVLPDGRLASGAVDNTVKIWNAHDGDCDVTLVGDSGAVFALAVLPDGRLASGSGGHTIKLWNTCDGSCDDTLVGHSGSVYALALLPDGRLVSGSGDNTIKFWNLRSGECEATLEGHTSSIYALALMPDGRLASGSDDNSIKLWSTADPRCLATLQGHTDSVSALVVLRDGRLASASYDHTIKLWNARSGDHETLRGHAGQIYALTLLDHDKLASGSAEGTIKLWSTQHAEAEATLHGHAGFVSALAPLPDGRVASGSFDSTIKLWSPCMGDLERAHRGHTTAVCALVSLPDGLLASGSDGGTIRLWDPRSGESEHALQGHTIAVSALAVLPDGRLVSGAALGEIAIWQRRGAHQRLTLKGHVRRVCALVVLPDGRLASGSYDKTIKLWDPHTGACTATLQGHANSVSALAVLADGRLASGSDDKTIKLWDPRNADCERTLHGHTSSVSALAVLPDGRLASSSQDKTIRLWDPHTGACTAILEGHTVSVSALIVLPDGRLASASHDNTLRLWNLRDASSRVLFVADAAIRALAFVPQVCTFAVGDEGGRVHFLQFEQNA